MITGLHGKAGAGKDAFADRLVMKHGFLKRGFAAPLYEEVAHAFRVTVPWLQDRSRKESPQPELRLTNCIDAAFVEALRAAGWHYAARLSPRQVLQLWGTEYRRAQDTDYWIKQFALYCKAAYSTGACGVVAPDTRYPNEAEFIRFCGGRVVEVVRPGLAPVEGEHASAKRLPDDMIDQTLYNVGVIADWWRAADEFVASLQPRTEPAEEVAA